MAETVKGGKYIQGDRFVDAEGRDLGPVKEEVKQEEKKPSKETK
jgi:hypothetical protein